MTLIALIALNAVLGAVVVGGLLVLLGRGILRDRDANRMRTLVATVEPQRERLAA
jgi:hypothetical protein